MSKILKPCPFCGGAAVVAHNAGWFGAGCETVVDGVMCNGKSGALQYRSEAAAITKWNDRASDKRVAEPVAVIIECPIMGGQTVKEVDGRWKFLKLGTNLYT